MSEDIKVTDGTILEALNNKVDIDGGNYKGSPLEEYIHEHCITDKITNCITEIPQRIKLELNNGTLTLKAGSEVIVPNGKNTDGSLKFDYVTIKNDLTYKPTWGNGYKNFAIVTDNQTVLRMVRADFVYSGATQPTPTGSGHTWYDTANNIVKRYDGTSWLSSPESFFIAEMTGGSDGIASIDQVFNGMGYIGTHFWLDKDVKMLLADGRNEDGTLKNKEVVINNVVIGYSYPTSISSYRYKAYYLRPNSINGVATSNVLSGLKKDIPTNSVPAHRWYFAIDENKWYQCNQNTTDWKEDTLIILNSYKWDRDKQFVSEYKQEKYAFKALDYNDKSEVSSWSMPSNKYIDLALGASGTTYTAPANGWFCVSKLSTATAQAINCTNLSNGLQSTVYSSTAGQGLKAFIPVVKGDSFSVIYSAAGTAELFRFVYAKGEV